MMSRVYAEASAGLLPAEPARVVGQINSSRAPSGSTCSGCRCASCPLRFAATRRTASRPRTGMRQKRLTLIGCSIFLKAMPRVEEHSARPVGLLAARPRARKPNLIGGDSLSGSHHLDQNFFMHPAPGWSRYRTSVRNLYLCGASTWPGAGTGAGSASCSPRCSRADPFFDNSNVSWLIRQIAFGEPDP